MSTAKFSLPPASWPRALVLAVALAFFGFAVGTFVQRDDDKPPSEDSVDVGFLQDMDYHHDQAVVMGLMQLAHGEEPDVDSLAKDVVLFQSYEMGKMQGMLEEWGYSTQEGERPADAMVWMDMPVPVEQMMGIIDEERMDELDAATGREADALFMELMVEHHLGGLHMAEYAVEHAETDFVRDLAGRILRGQAKEINIYAGIAEKLGLPVDIEKVDVPDLPE